MRKFFRGFLLVLGAAAVAGCATNRGVLDVETVVDENPETGVAVKFARISDNREFFMDPPQANMPSLKGGEIGDEAITSRAIARKRNSFGQALGDILLPEGDTVTGLVEEQLTDSFRDSGYRVVEESDADFANAIPLEVDIDKFWGWFQPGFWQIKLQYETVIRIQGPLDPYVSGKTYENKTELGAQSASGKNWLRAIQLNLDEITDDVKTDLKAAQ